MKDENEKELTAVKTHFDRQKDVVEQFFELRHSLVIPSVSQEKNEEDTFALVYSDTRYNK